MPDSTNHKKILIIDDSSTNNLLFQHLLQEYGYEVTVRIEGKNILDVVNTEKPNLILLDIMMPGIDGFEVLREIKTNIQTQHIPVIMFTSMTDSQTMKLAKELGADDFLIKPTSINEMLRKVRTHL